MAKKSKTAKTHKRKFKKSNKLTKEDVKAVKSLASINRPLKQGSGPGIGGIKGIMASYMNVKLRSVKEGQLTSSFGILANDYFWLNSLYQPYNSSSTRQPFGFDQYAALYENYIVTAADVKVTLWNSTTTVPVVACVTITDDTFSPASYLMTELIERSMVTKNSYKTITNTTNKVDVIKRKTGMAKAQGKTEIQYMTDLSLNGSAVNASPTNKVVMNIIMSSIDSSSTVGVRWQTDITYHARFYNPKFIANS